MSTPQRLTNAVENYFGPHDPEIKAEILDALDAHFRSPWIFSQDAQPDVGVKVICLDLNPLDGSVDVNTATRDEGSDWTDPECRFWWMHIPALPEIGEQTGRGQTRMDTGFQAQEAPETGQVYAHGGERE